MKRGLLYILFLVAFASCSDRSSREPDEILTDPDGIYVASSPRQAAEGIEVDKDGFIIIDSFDDESILYFSQMGPTKEPDFFKPDNTEVPYLYQYKYSENEAANWNENFNFKPKEGVEPFKWNTVTEVGSYGNAFHFFGMYFPGDNTPKFEVRRDQRGPEADRFNTSNFVLSDVMGAYHATSSLYTRMRFNLFHLMVYLKVKLYVPVFRSTVNPGGQASYSGFDDNAVDNAYVLGANSEFSIEWRANRSSDVTAPVTYAKGNKGTITMYGHKRQSGVDPIVIDISDYYTGSHTEDTDEVRVYEFSVLFPNQSFGDNFLCFSLRAPDGQMKYYYFSGSQVVGDRSNYTLSQGTLQELTLYLPRTTNQTILVQAKILPWNDAQTDMTVSKQEPAN